MSMLPGRRPHHRSSIRQELGSRFFILQLIERFATLGSGHFTVEGSAPEVCHPWRAALNNKMPAIKGGKPLYELVY